jgi:hypothetical protein
MQQGFTFLGRLAYLSLPLTLTFVVIYLLAGLTVRSPEPLGYFYGWYLSVDRHDEIEALPRRDRASIERVLRGWRQKREPGDTVISSSRFFERNNPGCYSVTYSTLNDNAKIYVLYDADGQCLISRDDD